MLYRFLQYALDTAVRIPDFAGQFAHTFHIDLTQYHEERNDGYGETSQ